MHLFGLGRRSAKSPRETSISGEFNVLPPLILHFDVNKSVILSDSIKMMTIEEGVREGIADLFWGFEKKDADGKLQWEWTTTKPSCGPPDCEEAGSILCPYTQYCKDTGKDRKTWKEAVKSFSLVKNEKTRVEMENLCNVVLNKMQLPKELASRDAAESGLKGATIVMFPAVFQLIALLQRSGRSFAVCFRSFGADHMKIKEEWNAFCEMRHPVFSHLLKGVGPLDGSRPGVPDRRVHGLHTLYRDSQGPVLLLDSFTNGPADSEWDTWAKQKPKPDKDTRDGRAFIKALGCQNMDGMSNIRKWLFQHLNSQATAAIKDDWAWWTWNSEDCQAGKLMPLLSQESNQLFFDDNVEHENARIVDCRAPNGSPVPFKSSKNKFLCKVNPVEALLDDDYFIHKLQKCHGSSFSSGGDSQSVAVTFQQHISEADKAQQALSHQVKDLNLQLLTLNEGFQKMKLLRRINVRDEAQLRDLLAKDVDVAQFGQGTCKKVEDLFVELSDGHCWLEQDDKGQLVRILEMLFLKIQYKDLILVESQEQDSDGRILTRNYLPGVKKTLSEASFEKVLDKFWREGLGANMKSVLKDYILPVYNPDAPNQTTGATQNFPLRCKVQQSMAAYRITEKDVEQRKELLSKIGLPGGKHFTTSETDIYNVTRTHFWRWDKVATWEAQMSMAKGGNAGAQMQTFDIAAVINKVFGGHPRRDVYENMLLQMFENFTASKLCGGFSGSVVIRVQPFNADATPADPCIVKLDAGEPIREEFINSENVFAALPDRAAKILGDAVYAVDQTNNREYGAMRLELAGACWNVPELAQGSANLLTTFKDLLLYEGDQVLLGEAASSDDIRPFGNVNSVLAETFGAGGVVSSLRKGGKGLRRTEDKPLPWSWYTLKGKDTEFNPLTVKKDADYAPTASMRTLYKKYFGTDFPDLKDLVVNTIKPQLEDMGKLSTKDQLLMPLVGLAHGDLNAANIMIDALDAVWLIDFATSVELPIFTDMCKFEMAGLFEYAAIPVTPEAFVEFASKNEEQWEHLNVGDWLRVNQEVACSLLKELIALGAERLASIDQRQLDSLIEDIAQKTRKKPHKQREIVRAIKARLCPNQAQMDNAFGYCAQASQVLLQGDYIGDSLDVKTPPMPEGPGAHGASSLLFFMEMTASVRKFMLQDVMNLAAELNSHGSEGGTEPVEAMSLQIWLPFLRESFRILGYRDICPQQKMWAIYHCKLVGELVVRTIDSLKNNWRNMRGLPVMAQFQAQLENRKDKKSTVHSSGVEDLFATGKRGCYTESDSLWIFSHRDAFPQDTFNRTSDRCCRLVHQADELYRDRPGLYAPIFGAHSGEKTSLGVGFDPKGTGTWRLFIQIKEDEEGKPEEARAFGRQSTNAGGTKARDRDPIGYVTPGTDGIAKLKGGNSSAFLDDAKGERTPVVPGKPMSFDYSVVFHSRLLPLSILVMNQHQEEMAKSVAEPQFMDSTVSLEDWSGGLYSEREQNKRRPSRALDKPDEGRARVSAVKPGQKDGKQSVVRYLQVPCVARDDTGTIRLNLTLELGLPACCYPPGALLCVDTNTMPAMAPELVIDSMEPNGAYIAHAIGKDGAKPVDFNPLPMNHIYLKGLDVKAGDHVLYREGLNWVDSTVKVAAMQENGWLPSITAEKSGRPSQSNGESGTNSNKLSKDISAYGIVSSVNVSRHLTLRNSGKARLQAGQFDEEVNRLKVFYKARHSAIIDALSGARLNVKECAMPVLQVVDLFVSTPMDSRMSASLTQTPGLVVRRRSSSSATGGGAAFEASMLAASHGGPKGGMQLLQSTLDKYENCVPACTPNAFIILGSPGSGKSCLVYRLMIDYLDRERNMMPLLVSIADLVKRSSKDVPELNDPEGIAAWFYKYLQITFGENSLRYRAICQAIAMHRVLFLFEGLEDGGSLSAIIEHVIKDIILDRHMVVITSRPFLAGSSSTWESMYEHVIMMKIQNLTNEHKRMIAHARLGPDGLRAFDNFFQQIQEKNRLSDEDTDHKGEEEDVFGNPMMLSMLICYLQMRQKELDEAKTKEPAERRRSAPRTDSEDTLKTEDVQGVTITNVYRVALDVMITRVQSKQQADRFKKDAQVDACKKVLEKLAMKMHARQKQEIDVAEVDEMFSKGPHKEEWRVLKTSVQSGHAMFLRISEEHAGNYEGPEQRPEPKFMLRFLVNGFQCFFAACQIAHGGGDDLPALVPLLTETWWVQMMEMLAEYSAHTYVQLIERKLEQFAPQSGETFLHIAAKVGHRPVFEHLKLFKEEYQKALWLKTPDLWTPLHIAAGKGHTDLCKLMLDNKASIDSEDRHGCLPMHQAMTNGHFQCAKQLLDKWVGQHGADDSKRTPKSKKGEAEVLAEKFLKSQLTEEKFLEEVNSIFLELQYFGKTKDQMPMKKKALGSLLAVYWICANLYDKFVRGQSTETRLTKSSWDLLQTWTTGTVKLTETPAFVGAMLVYVGIMDLGKIKPFQNAFAPGYDDPTAALAHVLEHSPIIIPSFFRLEENFQKVILQSMKAEFNFGQFLQAENLPANLNVVKDLIADQASSKVNVLGFFLFRLFIAMCGLSSSRSLEGSLFMIDKLYSNFRVGLDVMEHLREESAHQVYMRFLAQRSINQGLSFEAKDPVSRAKVRLACLSRVLDDKLGKELSDTFDQLPVDTQNMLTKCINTDGIQDKPGFLIFGAPDFMEKSRNAVGMRCSLLMLLRIYQACAATYKHSDKAVVTVYIKHFVDIAGDIKDTEVFDFTPFEVVKSSGPKAELIGNLTISPWQFVRDQKKLDDFEEVTNTLIDNLMSRNVREPGFMKKIALCFPELKFFVGDETVNNGSKRTIGSLLSLFWVMTDSADAFRRGQAVDDKLSDKSWALLMDTMQRVSSELDFCGLVMCGLAIMLIGRIPKFGEQLAPGVKGYKEILRHVLVNCKNVCPSFARMNQWEQNMVRECLTQDFDFEQFVSGEGLPMSLTNLKDLLQTPEEVEGPPSGREYFQHFKVFTLLELAGSMGAESLEGSVYMTEQQFLKYNIGMSALEKLLSPECTEQMVWVEMLRMRAKKCEFNLDEDIPDTLALARIACLCNVSTPAQMALISTAWGDLDSSERDRLTEHLTADGIRGKTEAKQRRPSELRPAPVPAFVLVGMPAFLECAWNNPEVGILSALRVMLRIYEDAITKFDGSEEALVSIQLGQLSAFAKVFFGSVAFQDLPFDLRPTVSSSNEAVAIPKAWIPVSNPQALEEMNRKAATLSADLLSNRLTEDAFKARVSRCFPELNYFPPESKKLHEKTLCAMLSLYWLITGQHESFIRSQRAEELLSVQSWSWIQGWMTEVVKIFDPQAVDAALVFMAIHALGSVREFREELARGFDEHYHDLALAHVLESNPEVVPSFARLPEKYQKLIFDSLNVDFKFSQFLQAENLPANLSVLKEKLQSHGDEGFAFFCFRIFTQTCGKLGPQSLEGSLFMTESEFQRFRPGLDALQQLRTLDAGEAYQAFLRFRGSMALSRFATPGHQAKARLLCLGGAFDFQCGDVLIDAFDELPEDSKLALTRWLTSDGIREKPGYILCHVPTLLQNAKANEAVGLKEALEMLLRVQMLCEQTVSDGTPKVVVDFSKLAAWAKEVGDPNVFSLAEITLRTEKHTSTEVFTIEVKPPEYVTHGRVRRMSGVTTNSCWCACLNFILFICFIIALGGAYCEFVQPRLVNRLGDRVGIHLAPKILRYGSAGSVCLFFFLFICVCWIRSRTTASVPYQRLRSVSPDSKGFSKDSDAPLLSRRGYVMLDADESDLV